MAPDRFDFDYIVIGSGFGGSVSACRLAEKGYRVAVFESGRRWAPHEFPASTWDFKRWLWRPSLGWRGFFGMRFFRHLTVLQGHAVGGGSITYANVLLTPGPEIWDQGPWAGLADWKRVMPGHYETARRMLGVTQNRFLGEADRALQQMAAAAGVGETFYLTDVATNFDACTGCGGCMVGCRHNAKNTLDKNYLYLAERSGAQVFAETSVTAVIPLDGVPDGSAGYSIETTRGPFRSRGVVCSASSLGTLQLLFRMREKAMLPRISGQLGKHLRTNAESIIGIRFPGTKSDLSKGVAIGSGFYLDKYTHIQATRYPEGSDAMGLFSTVLTSGRPGLLRIAAWLGSLLRLLIANPSRGLRMLLPFRYAKETLILLVMQTLDGQLNMEWRRPWYWPFARTLTTTGDRIPAFIPAANEFAAKMAECFGGIAGSSLTEILFNVPMTAHCLGGAVMGRDASEGVVDFRCRVFGYANMLICDSSIVGANLGVNPALTIAALTEHAMSFIEPAPADRDL